MRNIFVISVFSCLFALSAAAQNLDPTVEVRREYEGKLVEVHKPVFEMSVPDSVTRFALDFDYSVFDNPYKGSYEFNPYLLSMRPSASDNGESNFYLRAGAGYQLRPTVDMVWSPSFKRKGVNMDVYAHHKSFIGDYLTIAPSYSEDSTVGLGRLPKDEKGSHKWSGYDMLTKAGAIVRHDWGQLAIDYSAGYYGLAQKDRLWNRGYNALDASFGLQTKPDDKESFMVDLDVDYRFAEDVVLGSELKENLGHMDLTLRPFWVEKHRMSLEVESNVASYTGAYQLVGGDISMIPRFVFIKDRLTADLGLRISKMLTDEDVNEQVIYPDVNFTYVLLPKSLKFYFKATGGGQFETYSSTIGSNHHITHLMPQDMLGYKIERIGLTAGLDGRITDKFSYNLRAGYSSYANLRHYQVEMLDTPFFSMTYLGCQKWFAAADFSFDIEDFRFNGTLSYDRYWENSNIYSGGVYDMTAILKPAPLTGKMTVQYNWKQRLLCGADCEFAGVMKGSFSDVHPGSDLIPVKTAVIRGYADAGVFAEYATARNITLWMRGGNLLNQTIQRTPLYAEKGVNFTLGVCMNL